MQIPPALIRPTNLSWFKQISKGQIYQLNCRFLSKINFNLLNPITDISYLNLWDIFRLNFRRLRMTTFQKVMVTEKIFFFQIHNNFAKGKIISKCKNNKP